MKKRFITSDRITCKSNTDYQYTNMIHHRKLRRKLNCVKSTINFLSPNNLDLTRYQMKSSINPLNTNILVVNMLFVILNIIITITGSHSLQSQSIATSDSVSSATCQLPLTWAGKWYQTNKEPIRITNTEISDKGVCRDRKGDKYLFESTSNKQQQLLSSSSGVGAVTTSTSDVPCLVCLVFSERHLNVLQYKESSCQPVPASFNNNSNSIQQQLVDNDHSLLESICSGIDGDADMWSLFRLDTPPIECPINGRFSFTYDNCREPQSTLDSCIDKKQLNFKFSACPDVPGSESKFEVLKCYADWIDSNNENDKYYMIGRLEHASNPQDRGKFRCFVYEKLQDGRIIQMAQSLEETCYGLISPYEGPKTLRLTVKPPTAHKCHFPSYIHSQSENWLSVDNSLIYMFTQNSTKYQVKETKEGNVIEEATCLQHFAHPHSQHPNPNLNIPSKNFANQHQIHSDKRYTSTSYNPQIDQSPQQTISKTSDVYLVHITKNCPYITTCFNKNISQRMNPDYCPTLKSCLLCYVDGCRCG